jgi:hypothetical protein
MNRKANITLATSALASLGFLVGHENLASARSVASASGSANTGADAVFFDSLSFGTKLKPGTTGLKVWTMSLPLDNPGLKAISISGSASANSSLACSAIHINPLTGIRSFSNEITFPPDGVWRQLPLNQIDVVAGGLVKVHCGFTGTALLAGVNVTPV